jgi:hypothetical protein
MSVQALFNGHISVISANYIINIYYLDVRMDTCG